MPVDNAFRYDSRQLRSDPYLECTKRAEITKSTDVNLHCWAFNDHTALWIHVRAKSQIQLGGWVMWEWFKDAPSVYIWYYTPGCAGGGPIEA